MCYLIFAQINICALGIHMHTNESCYLYLFVYNIENRAELVVNMVGAIILIILLAVK